LISGRSGRAAGIHRLTPFRSRLAEKLSGGMKQKLALACTLIHARGSSSWTNRPPAWIRCPGGDFWKILQSLRKGGITIVMSTPYLDEAERCSRVALLNQGRLLRIDTPESLRHEMRGEVLEIVCDPVRRAFAALGKGRDPRGPGLRRQAQCDRPERRAGSPLGDARACRCGHRPHRCPGDQPHLENVFIHS